MRSTFYIAACLKVDGWHEPYARFYLGSDRTFAAEVFRQLKAIGQAKSDDLLQLDLVEIANGVPVTTDIISCSLEQFSENAKIITREVFKSYHLHGSP